MTVSAGITEPSANGAIVELCEKLDIERQGQHRPCALPEHGMADAIGVDVEAIAVGQNLADHRVDAAEQRLMLQLLIAEPDQRLERSWKSKATRALKH